ncbi:MAG: dinitrogenase iron-molybdenum cofactor biosynthesis protein, partial [Candidatus Electrothrix sp. EH2]|nr:dinitrogenase iron-molybdenum cofactor biosynthesis protein [Candidatus Electrothrix sp. EH2]
GQASQVLIYGPREDGLACLLESRPAPEAGSGDSRWQALAEKCLFDCFALLATHAGKNPQKVLGDLGIKVLLTEENIEGTVEVLYGGGKKKNCKK